MHDISHASDHEAALRHELHKADAVPVRHRLAAILRDARRREAWLIALVGTIGALLILIGLLILIARQPAEPAPAPSSSSTRIWEA